MEKKKKWKINWETVERNLYIIGFAIIIGFFTYKVMTQGLSWISTIGYFD